MRHFGDNSVIKLWRLSNYHGWMSSPVGFNTKRLGFRGVYVKPSILDDVIAVKTSPTTVWRRIQCGIVTRLHQTNLGCQADSEAELSKTIHRGYGILPCNFALLMMHEFARIPDHQEQLGTLIPHTYLMHYPISFGSCNLLSICNLTAS